jgi:hypothetical protein
LDRSLLVSLAANSVGFTLPPGGEDQLESYTANTIERYGALDYGDDSSYTLLVAENSRTRQGAGYVLLHEDDDGCVLLDDLAGKREYWGRYIGHFLVRSVENLLLEHGYPILYAEISAANRRSYLTAVRQLRFRPDFQYWTKMTGL